jgi:hypothetical protein
VSDGKKPRSLYNYGPVWFLGSPGAQMRNKCVVSNLVFESFPTECRCLIHPGQSNYSNRKFGILTGLRSGSIESNHSNKRVWTSSSCDTPYQPTKTLNDSNCGALIIICVLLSRCIIAIRKNGLPPWTSYHVLRTAQLSFVIMEGYANGPFLFFNNHKRSYVWYFPITLCHMEIWMQ